MNKEETKYHELENCPHYKVWQEMSDKERQVVMFDYDNKQNCPECRPSHKKVE